MIDKASAEGISAHGPRYQWSTDKGKSEKGRLQCFGEVLDLGADFESEGSRPTPRAVLVYGPYSGRQGVTKAAQVATEAARVLNTAKGALPVGEPIWLDNLERVPDRRVPGLSRQIATRMNLSTQIVSFDQQVMTEAASIWQFERTIFRTKDGEEYHIDVRRAR